MSAIKEFYHDEIEKAMRQRTHPGRKWELSRRLDRLFLAAFLKISQFFRLKKL